MPNTDETAIVTVGIPFLNAENYLKMAIASVFAQTLTNWHLILMDDGSTDDSLRIAQSFSADPRVTVVSDGLHLGLATRLNQISGLATTPYIARMDADDLMSTNRLRTQVDYLITHPNTDLTATGLISMSNSCDYQGYRYSLWPSPTTYSILSHKIGIAHATVLGRTEWFIRNPYRNGFDRAEDVELWVRTNNKDDLKIDLIEGNLYFYREYGSTSSKNAMLSVKSHRLIAGQFPMSHRERFHIYWRLALTKFASLLTVAGFIRITIQRRRNSHLKSDEHSKYLKLELSKINKFDRGAC